MPEQKQSIEVVLGPNERIAVSVERKRVKNIRLKVYPGGEVKVSAPIFADLSKITEFVRSKSAWIKKCIDKKKPDPSPLPELSEAELLFELKESVDRLYPIVKALGVKMPAVTVRPMKTRWGSCSVHGGSIRLNRYLCRASKECIDYVVLHELAHFLYPDHSKNFYGFIERFMPDWKKRRNLLKQISLPD